MAINPTDLLVSSMHNGIGGQHICRPSAGIQLTHIPTGIVVECDTEQSQHRNKLRAIEMLAEKLKEAGHE
jgi:protein subunit release factor A